MDPILVAEPSFIQTVDPYVARALEAFIGLIMAGAYLLARRYTGMAETQISQDAVNKAAASMTEAILREYGAYLQSVPAVTANDPAVIKAADYVERRLPDSLKQLDMKSADVRDLMATRINAGLANSDMIEVPVPVRPAPAVAAPRRPAAPVAVPRDLPALEPEPIIPPEVEPTQETETAEAQSVAELKAFLEARPELLQLLKEMKV